MMSEVFNFTEEFTESQWLVKDLIPLGHLCILLAHSGKGKSFVLENLACCCAFEKDFLGLETEYGDVLIVDQDTPKDVLKKRISRFGKAFGGSPKHNIFISSMEGLSLYDYTVHKEIGKHNGIKMAIIDSLHSVCGKADPNVTATMSPLIGKLKDCLHEDSTIIVAHHLSEKINIPLSKMLDFNEHLSGMGSSVIKQQADTEYVLGSKVTENRINRMYLKPIAKRQNISQKIYEMVLIEPSRESLALEFAGYYEPEFGEIGIDLLLLLEDGKEYTIKEIREATGHKWGENQIRECMSKLEESGRVVMSRNLHNLFKYRIPRRREIKEKEKEENK